MTLAEAERGADRLMARQAQQAQARGRNRPRQLAQSPQQQPPKTPQMMFPNPFADRIGFLESRDKYGEVITAPNGDRVVGRYQFTPIALKQLGITVDKNGNWKGLPGIRNEGDFRKNTAVQDMLFRKFIAENHRQLTVKGVRKHVGRTFRGIRRPITITEGGLAAAAHRMGPERVKQYLKHLQSQGWVSNASKFPSHLKSKFLAIETRLREFEKIPFNVPQP